MAHYALLDENNIVVQVITGVDENIIQTDLNGNLVGGSSEAWELFYTNFHKNIAKNCKRTSYNRKIRFNYAGIGFKYDEIVDAFIPPKPNCNHADLRLNDKYQWECDNPEHEKLDANNSSKNSN